jgi:hypothetical protein
MFSEFADKSVALHQLGAIQPLYKGEVLVCDSQSESVEVELDLSDHNLPNNGTTQHVDDSG